MARYGSSSSQHQGQQHRSGGGAMFQGHPSRHGDSSTFQSSSQSGATLSQRSWAAAPISQSMAKRAHQGQQGHGTRGTSVPTGKGSHTGHNKSSTYQTKGTYAGNSPGY